MVGLEEIFNSSPQIQARMNSTLASGMADFPDKMVPRHPDCFIVLNDNTYGLGGDWLFPERRAGDAAFRDRLTFLDWPYDEVLETKLGLARNPNAQDWIAWVQAVRAFVLEHQTTQLVVSPRATMSGATALLHTTDEIRNIAESTVFKGIAEADVESILSFVPLPSGVGMRGERPDPEAAMEGINETISEVKDDPNDRPEEGKTYLLSEISKGKTWAEAEVDDD